MRNRILTLCWVMCLVAVLIFGLTHKPVTETSSIAVITCKGNRGLGFFIDEGLVTAKHVCDGEHAIAHLPDTGTQGFLAPIAPITEDTFLYSLPLDRPAALKRRKTALVVGERLHWYGPFAGVTGISHLAPLSGPYLGTDPTGQSFADGTVWFGASGGPVFDEKGMVVGVVCGFPRRMPGIRSPMMFERI